MLTSPNLTLNIPLFHLPVPPDRPSQLGGPLWGTGKNVCHWLSPQQIYHFRRHNSTKLSGWVLKVWKNQNPLLPLLSHRQNTQCCDLSIWLGIYPQDEAENYKQSCFFFIILCNNWSKCIGKDMKWNIKSVLKSQTHFMNKINTLNLIIHTCYIANMRNSVKLKHKILKLSLIFVSWMLLHIESYIVDELKNPAFTLLCILFIIQKRNWLIQKSK